MEQQYLWIIHQNKSRGMSEADAVAAADKWALDTIMARKKREATIKKYAPPQLTPDQMVRVAQKSIGNIPGGLLSEEGPGQMAPPSLLEGAYVNKIPSQQDMWKSQAHSMSPNYLAQDSESVELPSHHAMHGGGYSLGTSSTNINPMAEPDYPRFPAANQMGVVKGYDHQRVNPPLSLTGGTGPLASDPGPTPQQVGWGGDMSPAEKNQYIQALGFLQQQLAKDRQKQPVQWMQMVPPRRRR